MKNVCIGLAFTVSHEFLRFIASSGFSHSFINSIFTLGATSLIIDSVLLEN